MKTKIKITGFLVIIALAIGIFFLFSGIKGVIEVAIISRNYQTTEGYLSDYEIYSKGSYNAAKRKQTNNTYRLIYQYQVEGHDYEVATDMGVGVVPEIGSIKEIQYNPNNPSDALILGPNSNIFKTFFGLFFTAISSLFIWILKPEKEKLNKQSKHSAIDGLGAIIGFGMLVFSYGFLYFITGELTISGIVNFYKTSFIFPMIIPILLFVVGGYLLIKSIFLNHRKIARGCMIVGIFLLVIIVGVTFENSNPKHSDKVITRKVDFSTVHNTLVKRNFETANIATTYWSYDENKLTNVVAGLKNDDRFEFYEYSDGKTTDKVYNRILSDISKELEHAEREETELQGGGKIFILTNNGICRLVMYKDNVVIYANYPEKQNEIQDILIELRIEFKEKKNARL